MVFSIVLSKLGERGVLGLHVVLSRPDLPSSPTEAIAALWTEHLPSRYRRGFFDFLHDTIQARLEGQPGPSLLPAAGNALESGIAAGEAA